MRPFSELIHTQIGRPGVAMGGGVSLPEQAARAPAGAVFVSANQHGCFLRPCDYIVACDDLSVRGFKHPDGRTVRIRDLATKIISSRRSMADYHVVNTPVNNSGMVAAWALWAMGCAPVLLAGMDCFQGGTYFHDRGGKSSGTHLQLVHHLNKWRKLRAAIPAAPLRSLGGPLLELFPAYDPAELFPAPIDRGEVERQVRGIRAKVLRAWPMGHRPFAAGEEVELTQGELELGLRKRFCERIAA